MRVSLILTALLAAVLAVGVSTTAAGAQDSGTAVSPAQTFDLNFGEFYFAPNVLTARPGTITVNLTNLGPERVHSLSVQDADGNDIVIGDRVDPGDSGMVQFSLPEGTYRFYCPIGSHAERGEVGTLIIAA